MNREILRIALPSIITNITVPLLGLVDLAIVGHIGEASSIGAISVGTMIFNMVYWIFNFLRFGTSGLTAQAFGRKDTAGIRDVFRMALTVALACGLFVVVLQRPIEMISGWIISPSDDVWQLAISYFRVRIWAAPAVIVLFAMNGWFVGMQNSRIPMYIAIGQNIINIIGSYLLVFHFNMGIEGVALGTVISQYVGLAAAFTLWHFKYGDIFRKKIEGKGDVSYSQFFTVNRDMFFRMIFMLAVTCAFTSIGAREGDTLLAVNTLLMQLFILFSYFSDGFALAGEALIGRYIGALEQDNMYRCVRLLFAWAIGGMVVFSLAYLFGCKGILMLLTSDLSVVEAATPYIPWAIAIPIASFAAFAWDGIYIGATASRQMLYTLFFGAAVFFGIYFGGVYVCESTIFNFPFVTNHPTNHLLWLSFIAYLATRSIAQTIMASSVLRKPFLRNRFNQ